MPDQQSHIEVGNDEIGSIELNTFEATFFDEECEPCVDCPEPEVPDITPPVVSGFLPAPGTVLGVNDPVQFDVTDTSGSLRAVVVAVSLVPSGSVELAYDPAGFMPRYRNSSMVAIANGLRFSLRRVGGWAGQSIDVKVIAVDPSGNLDE